MQSGMIHAMKKGVLSDCLARDLMFENVGEAMGVR